MSSVPVIRVGPFDNLRQEGIAKAADVLLAGGVVAFPTESFYGLAVDATNEKAITRLFSTKKRPADLPVLILIPSSEVLKKHVAHLPEIAHRLTKSFWPGGLTMIFESDPEISTLLTAKTGKIGIRYSSHPVATALSQATGAPISGTSANISGKPACKNIEEILNSFKEGINLIIDGGESPGNTGSTILDVTQIPPRILREGIITKEQLNKIDQTISFS